LDDLDLHPSRLRARQELGGGGRGCRRIRGHDPDPGACVQSRGDHGLVRLEKGDPDQLLGQILGLGEDGTGEQNAVGPGARRIERQGADPLGAVGREAPFPGVGEDQVVVEIDYFCLAASISGLICSSIRSRGEISCRSGAARRQP
jgi:hypothetical protein